MPASPILIFSGTSLSPSFILSFLVASALAGSPLSLNLAPRNWNVTTSGNGSNAECMPYYYAPVNTKLSSFPNIWEPATIMHGDTNAEAKWESIKASVPKIPPKGTPTGDFSGLDYPDTDDDCWWTYSKCVNPNLDGIPNDVADIPEPHTLAYGFDDGPNCSHNAFYDYLVQEGQKATMFYIGSNVMDWPLEAQRAVADGHEICVLTGLSSRDVFAELYYTMQAIKLVTNLTPTCWRPPFGDVDNRVRAIAHGLGLRTILWKYDSNDWRVDFGEGGKSAVAPDVVDANYEKVLNESASGAFDTVGAILLAHELNNFTMQEAVKYFGKLKASFKNMVPIQVALNNTHPYVEDGGAGLGSFEQYTSSRSTFSPTNASDISGNAPLPGSDSNNANGGPTTSSQASGPDGVGAGGQTDSTNAADGYGFLPKSVTDKPVGAVAESGAQSARRGMDGMMVGCVVSMVVVMLVTGVV